MIDSTYSQPMQLIGGVWREGRAATVVDVLDPATGEKLSSFRGASDADVDDAIEAVVEANGAWRSATALERAGILRNAAAVLRSRESTIARLLCLDQGKPLAEGVREVSMAADVLEWSAEEGRRTYGRVVPSRYRNIRQLVVKEPIGPVVALTPWNLPLLTPAMKIGAALAAGCPVVIKPAEETPSATIELAKALMDAGLPPGTLNLLLGEPGRISHRLISHPAISKVTFTGSTRVGKELAALAGSHAKRIALELGGHAPVLVFDDCDPRRVVETIAPVKFRNAGQLCVSPTRFFVQSGIYEDFVAAFASAASSLRVGSGLEPGTQMGPLANERRLTAVEGLVRDALAHGAGLVCGGARVGACGYFHAPTILRDVPDKARIMSEEPFGPVVPIDRFETIDEVVARANAVSVGLAAFVFTRDIARADEVTARLQTGMVGVNNLYIAQAETPFGGVKDSGDAREGGSEGVESYLITKFVSQGYL